jgi:hypothetical protein
MKTELYKATELLVQEIERIDSESRVPMEESHPDLVSLKDYAKDILNKANKPAEYMAIRETEDQK